MSSVLEGRVERPVIDAISILMAWRTVGDFQARVVHKLGNDKFKEYDLIARPRALSYELTDVESQIVDSFDGGTRELVSAGEQVAYETHMLSFEPLPVRLAFPMSLGIWGRSFDDYRIQSGHYTADDIVLSLAHTRSPEVHGKLTLSRIQRKAVRLDTPTQKIYYGSIEPL